MRSSPDGAALLVVEGTQRGPKRLRVFRRASFGSNENGIVRDLPENFNATSNFCVSSAGGRTNTFLMAFDVAHQRIVSSALKISREETEYQFRAKVEANNTAKKRRQFIILSSTASPKSGKGSPWSPPKKGLYSLVQRSLSLLLVIIMQANCLGSRTKTSKGHFCVAIGQLFLQGIFQKNGARF